MALDDRDYYRDHIKQLHEPEPKRATAPPTTKYPLWLVILASYGGYVLFRQVLSIIHVALHRS